MERQRLDTFNEVGSARGCAAMSASHVKRETGHSSAHSEQGHRAECQPPFDAQTLCTYRAGASAASGRRGQVVVMGARRGGGLSAKARTAKPANSAPLASAWLRA